MVTARFCPHTIIATSSDARLNFYTCAVERFYQNVNVFTEKASFSVHNLSGLEWTVSLTFIKERSP